MHLAAVWGATLVMLPRLHLAPPPGQWGARALASDLAKHAIYAYSAGWVYDRLARRARRRRAGRWLRAAWR